MMHALKSVFASRRRTIVALGATLTVVAGAISVKAAFADPPPKPKPTVPAHVSTRTNVRLNPSIDAEILTTLPGGPVEIRCQARGTRVSLDVWWDEIALPNDGRIGYVSDNFVLDTDSVGHEDGDSRITGCHDSDKHHPPVTTPAPSASATQQTLQQTLSCDGKQPANCISTTLPSRMNLRLRCDQRDSASSPGYAYPNYYQCGFEGTPEATGKTQLFSCDVKPHTEAVTPSDYTCERLNQP